MTNNTVIDITLFGEFSINNANKEFNKFINHSKKMRMFVEYLIINRERPVPFSEIIENLWGTDKTEKSAGALKTMLCRFRNSVESYNIWELDNIIVTKRGCYQLNPNLLYNIHAENFEIACIEAERYFDEPEKCLNIYKEAARIYKGDLLPKTGDEKWLVPKKNYYKNMFFTAMRNAVYLLKQNNDYEEIIKVCTKVLNIDIYDEHFNYELLNTYIELGKYEEALRHYNYITKLYYSKLGVHIDEEIRNLYGKIISIQKKQESDIDAIQKTLNEESFEKGAFICEYGIFKEIYHLEARCLERSGGTIFIQLINIESEGHRAIKSEKLDKIVNDVINVTSKVLRKGDVISRYSPNQIILLLPMVNVEDGSIIMDRIKKTYKKEYPKSNIEMNYDIRAVEPYITE